MLNPAIKGTINILKAANTISSVERVVITSSMASVSSGNKPDNYVFTEED